jgi:predicted RNA binding protein YcfA (HicA-like mRNA interferase family)
MPKLPVVSGADIVRALERLGFAVARQHGSYIVMRRGSAGCVVPNHRELKIGTLVFLQKNSSSHFMPDMCFERGAPSAKTSLAVSAPLNLGVQPSVVAECMTRTEGSAALFPAQPRTPLDHLRCKHHDRLRGRR